MSQEHPQKSGLIRGRGRFIARAVNPEVMMPDGSRRSSWSLIAGLSGNVFKTIGQAMAHIRQGLTQPPDPSAFTPERERAEYDRLYTQSGLTEARVRSIRTGLRVEIAVFIAFGIYSVVQIAYGLRSLGTGAVFALLVGLGVIFTLFAITRITIALWRLDMHASRRYRPIGLWLRRGHGG